MTNSCRWLIAGSLLGLVGAHLGMAMRMPQQRALRTARRSMARMTSRASRRAGNMITGWGESVARSLR